jgi:hypothetical protein
MILNSNRNERGYIALVTIMMLMLLLGTGLAYLKWSADESVTFKRQFAALQAYYMAQSALSQDIIPYLCNMQTNPSTITMQGNIDQIDYELPQGMEGDYEWNAYYVQSMSSQSTYGSTRFYNIEVTGKVRYTAFNRYENERIIEVDTTLYIKYNSANTFGIFMYLTSYETTIFGEKIKFFNGDTLWGRVHSNDEIAVMQSPVFYERVSSCAPDFWRGPAYNPILYMEPWFNSAPVEFPTSLDDLRAGAAAQGRFFSMAGYRFRVLFMGEQGIIIYRWLEGLPFSDTTAVVVGQYPPLIEGAIFIDAVNTEVLGTDPEAQIDYGVQGRVSVGTSGDMWLLDNLRYVDSNLRTGVIDSSTNNILGIMSESNILIKNTWENGRDNGTVQISEWQKDIIINGGIVALGQSFSFEDQNDVLTAYGGTLPQWYYSNGPTPDERGQIHMWGQISQYRRGYVHRSNHGGSGYLKDYHYDERFYWDPPPFYPYLDDSYGIDRQILAWGAGPVPVEPDTSVIP